MEADHHQPATGRERIHSRRKHIFQRRQFLDRRAAYLHEKAAVGVRREAVVKGGVGIGPSCSVAGTIDSVEFRASSQVMALSLRKPSITSPSPSSSSSAATTGVYRGR